jgi:hypothetical protein
MTSLTDIASKIINRKGNETIDGHSKHWWQHEVNNARADGYTRGYAAGKKQMRDAAVKLIRETDICGDAVMDELAEAIAALPVPDVQHCNWTQGYDDAEQNAWKTNCDSYWYIIDGSPSENGMKFCHGCGKPIAEHPYVEPEESE